MMEARFLAGRHTVITGGGHGIGRAVAEAFAREGARVALNGRRREPLEETAATIRGAGGDALVTPGDLTDVAAVQRVTESVVEEWGQIDVLVNNAGVGARVATADLPTDQWQRVLGIGLTGAFFCGRAAAKPMIAQGRGAIVNVASIMGLSGGGLYPNPAYHAVKGALVNLTRAWALEWAPHSIRVNAVAPAFVRTALVESLLADAALEHAILDATPLGRLIEPEEIAAAAVFLASDAAAMITGHTLPIDGGWLAR